MAQPLGDRPQREVVGSEVVAPGRDAVRLVDDQQLHSAGPQPLEDVVARQLFGCEEEHEGLLRVHRRPRLVGLTDRLRGVEHPSGRSAGSLRQGGHLVPLERDEGETTTVRPPCTAAGSW